MVEFQADLEKAQSPAPSTLNTLASEFAIFKTSVVSTLNGLQAMVSLLSREVDRIKMLSQQKILLFYCVPETKDEDTGVSAVHLVVRWFSCIWSQTF